MAQYAPPAQDSEAHTISEQAMLQELQNQFQAEIQLTPAGQQALIEIARLAAQNSGF